MNQQDEKLKREYNFKMKSKQKNSFCKKIVTEKNKVKLEAEIKTK